MSLIAPKADYDYGAVTPTMSEEPLVWTQEIVDFEHDAAQHAYPDNSVVFVGRSSMRLWTFCKEDMAPIPVIKRGFGGATLGGVDYYVERLVNAYKSAAVEVFIGTNDTSDDMACTPEQ